MSNENKDTLKTKRYREKRQTARFAFDIYLDDKEEAKVAEILSAAKQEKQLKSLIVGAVKKYKNI